MRVYSSGSPHDLGIRDRFFGVREADRTTFDKLPDLGEFLSVVILRDGSEREDVAVSGSRTLKLDELRRRAVIDHRRRVRHARDRGHAPRERRRCARFNGLVFFVTRLAQ